MAPLRRGHTCMTIHSQMYDICRKWCTVPSWPRPDHDFERITMDHLSDQLTEALCRADGHRWTTATEARKDVLRRHYEVAVQAVTRVIHPDGTPDKNPSPYTLPAWLHQRFGRTNQTWYALSDEEKDYWAHQARAVERAVARGGFKPENER